MPTKTVVINTVGTGTFTVPSDFGYLVALEAIGAGGSSLLDSTAGGGGAYAKSTTVGLNPGQVVFFNIGDGGNSLSPTGGDSWLNNATNSAPTSPYSGVLAKGGAPGASGGGSASSSVGDVKFNGGNGGTVFLAHLKAAAVVVQLGLVALA